MAYGKLLPRIWDDPEFTALDPQQQQLYTLLLSHSTRNHAGVLPLTMRRWALSTATADGNNVRSALMRLAQTRFVVLDWDTEEVLVRTYIRNDGVYLQPKVMKCAIKQALSTRSTILRKVIANEIRRLDGYGSKTEWQDAVSELLATSPHVESLNDDQHADQHDDQHETHRLTCVAVGNVSEVENTTNNVHQTPTTRTACAHEAPPVVIDDDTFDLATSERNSGLSRPVAVGVSQLVDDLVPPRRARGPERSRLILMAADVERVYGLDIVAMALRKWVETSKGAQILMSVASDVNAEGFHSEYSPNNGRPLATHDKKFFETQAMKDSGAPKITPQELFSRQKELRSGS